MFTSEFNRERNHLNRVQTEKLITKDHNIHNPLSKKIAYETQIDKQEGKNFVINQKERMDKRHHDATQWTKDAASEYGSFLKSQINYQKQ